MDAVEPVGVLGLHEDGAEGGDSGFVAADGGWKSLEKGGGEFGEGEVETVGGGGIEDASGFGGDFGERRGRRFWIGDKDDDVEFGLERGDEFVASLELSVERERGIGSHLELLAELAIRFERQ